MLINRIFNILRALSKEELKEFGLFIYPGYFNSNIRILTLYKAILRHYPALDASKVSGEKLFNRIYPGEKFRKKTYQYILSELFKLCEKFLVQKMNELTPWGRNLGSAYLERQLFKEAGKQLASSFEKLNHNKTATSEYFEEGAKLLSLFEVNMFLWDKQSIKQIGRSSEYYVYSVINNIAFQFHNIITKQINYNVNITEHPEYIFVKSIALEELFKYFENLYKASEEGSEKEIISISSLMSLNFIATAKDSRDEKHFMSLKALLFEYSPKLTADDQFNFYTMLETCCSIKRRYVDDYKYKREYFDIIKDALSKKLYAFENNYMQARYFRNVLQVALSLKEHKWAENFVKKYIAEISPELREEMFCFSCSELDFINGRYKEALENLNKINFKFEELKRFVKNLTIKLYYELNYFEEAYNRMSSYRHFLEKNKKISEVTKMPNKNFLMFTKELLDLRLQPDKYKLELLEKKINSTNWVSSKDWLLEKISEIENKRLPVQAGVR